MNEQQLIVWGGLGGVLVLNHLLVRTEVARRFPLLFWAVSATDAALAVGVCLYGVPGFHQGMVRLLVALVLAMHLAQNFRHRLVWAAEDRERALDAEYRAWRELSAGEPGAGPPPAGGGASPPG